MKRSNNHSLIIGVIIGINTLAGFMVLGHSCAHAQTVIETDGPTRITIERIGDATETGWSPVPVATVKVRHGADLQQAFRDAQPGDVIGLERGGEWVGGYSLNADDVTVTAFGDGPRPVIRPGGENGLRIAGSNLRLFDLDFQGPDDLFGRRGAGITSTGPLDGFYAENVRVQNMGAGANLQAGRSERPIRNVHFYRCAILDSIEAVNAPDGPILRYSRGILATRVEGFIVEECVIAGNGWREPFEREMGSHGLYIQYDSTGVLVVRCMVVRNSNNGVMARSGGEIRSNFLAWNVVGIVFGNGKDAALASGQISGNVVVEGVASEPTPIDVLGLNIPGYSWASRIADVSSVDMTDNVFANSLSLAANTRGVQFSRIVRHVQMRDNTVWSWGHPLSANVTDATGAALTLNTIGAPEGRSVWHGDPLPMKANVVRENVTPLAQRVPADLMDTLRAMERGNWTVTAEGLSAPWKTRAEGVR